MGAQDLAEEDIPVDPEIGAAIAAGAPAGAVEEIPAYLVVVVVVKLFLRVDVESAGGTRLVEEDSLVDVDVVVAEVAEVGTACAAGESGAVEEIPFDYSVAVMQFWPASKCLLLRV